MSYILDALRRAESERERDRSGPPGLNSQLHAAALQPEAGRAIERALEVGRKPWPKLVLALGLGMALALGVAAWWWSAGRATEPASDFRSAPVASSPPPVIAAAPVAQAPVQPPAAALPAPAEASAPALAPMPVVLPEPKKPPAKEKAERKAVPTPVIKALEPGSSEARLSNPEKPTASPAGSPAAMGLHQLPETLRRELPPLAVSGSMYSPQASSRMLVLDGQVVREGDQPRPGLVVESIGLKSATLVYRGERFQLSY
jgi:general secretion pathway protein B